jgi:hypothetical protein
MRPDFTLGKSTGGGVKMAIFVDLGGYPPPESLPLGLVTGCQNLPDLPTTSKLPDF